MAEFTDSKNPIGMVAQYQKELDKLIQDLEEEREVSESLRRHNRDLELQLQNHSLAHTSVAQHNLDVQQQVNNQLQQENQELKTLNNHLNEIVLKNHEKLKELKEARDALAASLKEKETQSKIFYKGSPDTDWIPLGTGHVTLEFKSANQIVYGEPGIAKTPINLPKQVEFKQIRGSEQPLNSNPETVIIDDPEYTSHSVRKLETKTKEELIKLCTRQAPELTHLIDKWKELKKQYADLEHRHGKVYAHREELAASVGLLSEKIHKLQTELEEAKKAHRTACENYAKKINILCSGKAWLEAGPDLFTARKELLDAKDEIEKLKRELNVVKSDYQNYKNKTFKAVYSPEAQNLHTQAQVSDLRRALEREQSGRRTLISKFIMILAKHVTDPAIIKSDTDLVNLFDAVLTDYRRSFNHSQQKVEGLCTSLNERNMKIADLEKKISELQQTMTDCFTTLRKFNNAQPSN